MNTSIWATEDKSFNIGCRVIKWDEPEGLSFLNLRQFYTYRNWDYETLKDKLKQFTIHWSVTYRAKHMFSGLKARGYSCNFMIDDDNVEGYATIYQNLPIQHAGWSQGTGLNALGPGVEISYMPNAWDEDMYDENDQKKWNVPPHPTTTAIVHGTKLKVHLPTDAQMNSLYQLIWGYCELFPDIKPEFPKDKYGIPLTTNLGNTHTYTGLVNHYHLKRGKIDAAGIDMALIEKEVKSRLRTGY